MKIKFKKISFTLSSLQFFVVLILNTWRFIIFIITFCVFIISCCISIFLLYIQIPPLAPFSTINNIFISVKITNFTLVFLKAACHAKPEAQIKFARSSSYIPMYIFWKFWDTSGNKNVSLWTYNWWYSPKFLFQNFYKPFLRGRNLHQ